MLAVKLDVVDQVSETGKTVTKVIVSPGTPTYTVVVYVLIGGAIFYLVGMILTICLRKHKPRSSEEEASTDSNFESIEDYTESSAAFSEFETTTRSSCVSVYEPGMVKDTMSNSSIGQAPMLPIKACAANYETQRYGVSVAKKLTHQRNVSKLIFN